MIFIEKIIGFSTDHPRKVIAAVVLLCLAFASQMPKIRIDTDPENMLSEKEFIRVFHNRVKKEFTLHDMIVLGVVNETHPDGVFNPDTLKRINDLTRFIETLAGVISIDMIAPSLVDDIQPVALGTVRFKWLMKTSPKNREGALHIRDRAMENPILQGTLVSEDGKALCFYIPIKAKNLSYGIASQIRNYAKKFQGKDRFFITGLPVAEDTFGVEMFRQMSESAPLAGLFIFVLMWFFFRNTVLVICPLIVAVASVMCAMGFLIGTGNTVHILSSMIPVFLMPIAVVDSIHILSEFHDVYPKFNDPRKAIRFVMRDLFGPMLFTSLTSAAGFASLALTPLPPVRVFGVFVAFGVLMAWLLTMTLIPAYISLLKGTSLNRWESKKKSETGVMQKTLLFMERLTLHNTKPVLSVFGAITVLSLVGISFIQVNDNPVKWFEKKHPIRIADRVLNDHFGGTYMAYLVLSEKTGESNFMAFATAFQKALKEHVKENEASIPQIQEVYRQVQRFFRKEFDLQRQAKDWSKISFLKKLESKIAGESEKQNNGTVDAWDEINFFISQQKGQAQLFKQPAMLRYMEDLENSLLKSGRVGKTNSVVDLVKKIHYELMEGNKKYNVIPKTAPAVAQTLLSFQNSHKPNDLWHLVTPGYDKANIWVQLKTGDNRNMESVVKLVERFFASHPPPIDIDYRWAGLTFLNVVWQDKMVQGMLNALMGSFVIVLIMMVFLFRSPLWGLLCMVPLTVTITFIYGVIGWIGKDYDMPTAVLSSLTLGLSVDFAIHFLKRAQSAYKRYGNWEAASRDMFEEPCRAIFQHSCHRHRVYPLDGGSPGALPDGGNFSDQYHACLRHWHLADPAGACPLF